LCGGPVESAVIHQAGVCVGQQVAEGLILVISILIRLGPEAGLENVCRLHGRVVPEAKHIVEDAAGASPPSVLVPQARHIIGDNRSAIAAEVSDARRFNIRQAQYRRQDQDFIAMGMPF
jgi:hypothetical protein